MKPMPGWKPIRGGPYSGSEYYPPSEPLPGKPVFLGHSSTTTQYEFNKDCTAVIWSNHVHARTITKAAAE